MKKVWLFGSLFMALAVACSSEAPGPTAAAETSGTPAAPSNGAVGADELEIVSGVPDRGRDPAVIAIDVGGEGLCSGTLIAEQIVMTARHCVSRTSEEVNCPATGPQITANREADTLGILVGDDITTAKLVAKGAALVVPPGEVLCEQDIALIILDRPVTGITPVGFNTGAVKVGDHVRAVGYGMTGPNSGAGVKLLREHVAIQAVSSSEIEVGEATCQGDSGGPALDEATSQVIGVVSRGGPACVGANVHNIYTRVDAFASLIEEAFRKVSQPGAPPADAGASSSKSGGKSKPSSDVGNACSKAADCATGLCVEPTGKGSSGYCSRQCGSGDRCPSGYHCEKSSSASEVCVRQN